MIWIYWLLRGGIVLACLMVLGGIIPISVEQIRTGNACPKLGPIPACHVVTLAYAAMALAVTIGWRRWKWVFFVGLAPVLLLALTGTSLELLGKPTCPRSANGWPLCYSSLLVSFCLLIVFMAVILIERRGRTANQSGVLIR